MTRPCEVAGEGAAGGPTTQTGGGERRLTNQRRPGPSRAARILACAPPDGATLAEWRAAYETATGEPAPASFGAEVASLTRRGYLRVVGGRAGRTRYARVDTPDATPSAAHKGGREDGAEEVSGDARATLDARDAQSPGAASFGGPPHSAPAGQARDVAATLAPDDFARAVLAAVAAAQAQAGGRDVTASAVVDTLLNHRLDLGGPGTGGGGGSGRAALTARVRSMLHTLARERRRGPAASRGAPVVCAPDPHTGRPRWRLAITPPPVTPPRAALAAVADTAGDDTPPAPAPPATATPVHATRTAAAVAAFAEAGRALGRPPSARETAWYLDGPGRPAPALRAQDVTSACRTVLRRSRVSDGHGMARACFAADRFVVVADERRAHAPTHARIDALVHALDAAVERLAVADERAGADRLAARAIRWRSAALTAFVDLREAACAAAFRAAVEPTLAALAGDDHDRRAAMLTEALAASAYACDVLDAWLDAARTAGRSADTVGARRRAVAAHRAHLRACGALVARTCMSPAPDSGASRATSSDPRMAESWAGGGEATTSDLAPYARAAARLAGLRESAGARVYGRARRVGARTAGRTTTGHRGNALTHDTPTGDRSQSVGSDHAGPETQPVVGPAAPARVDRVDALALLVAATTARRARALVREAVGLLGAAVRDAQPVRALLSALPAGDASTRHAAIVALGLLGHAPTWVDAIGETTARDGAALCAATAGDGRIPASGVGAASDAIAFGLAVALAGSDARAAQAALQAARALAPVHARGLLDTARARIGAGLWLTAVEA